MSEFDIQKARELAALDFEVSEGTSVVAAAASFAFRCGRLRAQLLSACDEIERLRAELAAEKTMRVMERENMKLHDEVFKP